MVLSLRLFLALLIAAPAQAAKVSAPVPVAPPSGGRVVTANVPLSVPGSNTPLMLNVPFTLNLPALGPGGMGPAGVGLAQTPVLTPQNLSLTANGNQVWQGENVRISLALPESVVQDAPVPMKTLTDPQHSAFQAEIFRQIEPQLREAGLDPSAVQFTDLHLGAARKEPVCVGCDKVKTLLNAQLSPDDTSPNPANAKALHRLFDGLVADQRQSLDALGMADHSDKLDEVSKRIVRATAVLRDPDVPAPVRKWLLNPSVMATVVGAKPTTRNHRGSSLSDPEMALLDTPEGVAQLNEAVQRISPDLGVLEAHSELVVYDTNAAEEVIQNQVYNAHFKMKEVLPVGDRRESVTQAVATMLTGGLFSGFRAHEGLLFGFPLTAVVEFAAKRAKGVAATIHMVSIGGEYELDEIAWGTRTPLAPKNAAGTQQQGRDAETDLLRRLSDSQEFEPNDNFTSAVWYDGVMRLCMHFLNKVLRIGREKEARRQAPAQAPIPGLIQPDYSPVEEVPETSLLERLRIQFESIEPDLDMLDLKTHDDIDAMAEAIEEGRWDAPVFADAERAVHLALAAHRSWLKHPWLPKVTLSQFATVVMRWEMAEYFGVQGSSLRAVPLTQGRGLSAEARRLFTEASFRYLGGMDAETLARFERELRGLPESERFLFVIDGSAPKIAKGMLPMYDTASKDPVSPSIGVIEAAMRAKHGANAVGLQLAFGEASREDLAVGIARGGRILGMGYPGVWQPGKFHEVLDGLWIYTMHDIYHLMWGARLTPTERQAPIRVFQVGLDFARQPSPSMRVNGADIPIRFPDKKWGAAYTASIDMDLEITADNVEDSLTTWAGPLVNEDGSLGLTALVLRDMGRNQALWNSLGITPNRASALAAALGPLGPSILEAGRAEISVD